MKDAGTDLTTNVVTENETNAEGLNLKHDEDHPSEQEMQAMEQAVMAEASMSTDSAMGPPPIKNVAFHPNDPRYDLGTICCTNS